MASPNVVKIIRAAGRLIINPANLTTPPAFGGTEIGIHRDVEIHFDPKFYPVTAEEWGHIPVDFVYCGQSAYLKAYARGMDVDALRLLWPFTPDAGNTLSDTPTQTSGTTRAGTLFSSKSVVLLFAPKDYVRHPAVIFYKAIPTIPEDISMPLSLAEELAFPIAYRAIPDSSGRTYAVGKMSGLSL